MSKAFTSWLDECTLPGSPATFSMHGNVARRRRSIFFGGRVALRVLWVRSGSVHWAARVSGVMVVRIDRQIRQVRRGGAGAVELAWWWSWLGARALGGGDGRQA